MEFACVGETGPDVLFGEMGISVQNLVMAPTRGEQVNYKLDRDARSANHGFSCQILESTTMRSDNAIRQRPPLDGDYLDSGSEECAHASRMTRPQKFRNQLSIRPHSAPGHGT